MSQLLEDRELRLEKVEEVCIGFLNYQKLLTLLTVSARCDVIQMAEVIASLNALKRGFALPPNETSSG